MGSVSAFAFMLVGVLLWFGLWLTRSGWWFPGSAMLAGLIVG